MNAETIFNKISESRLLKSLIKKGKIFFVGDAETVGYLQNFFEKSQDPCGYDYYGWEETEVKPNFPDANQLANYDVVIVASIQNEHLIFNELKSYIDSRFKIKVPIVKLFSDVFINLQLGHKLLQSSDCEFITPKISYIILSTPRSGSTALSEALTATKVAGFPQEHLRNSNLDLAQYCQFDIKRYLSILMSYQTTENGVFGTKIISSFLERLYQDNLDLNQLNNNFKFIYLIRRDKIAQAVSGFIASKTNMWHIYSEQQAQNYKTQLQKVKIQDSELADVHKIYQNYLQQERFIEDFFKQYQISPLIIEYEKFFVSPEEHLKSILKYLDIINEEQRLNILNKYQYFIHKFIKDLNIIPENENITIKLKTQKVPTFDLSKQIIRQYKERYS